MDQTFGAILKSWRERRRMSQLDLALTAEVSARHLSFLEQGRAHPSRPMVLRLARHLDVPLATRNTLLQAAGFAGHYRSRPLDEPAMDPIRAAVDRLLSSHDPYPAFVLDRHWTLVKANRTATGLLSALGVATGSSLLEVFLDRARVEATFENADEILHQLVLRLRTESVHYGGDAVLDRAANAIAGTLNEPATPAPSTAAIATRIRLGDARLSLITVVAHFGSTEDIALAELKIEMMFPADAATGAWLNAAKAN